MPPLPSLTRASPLFRSVVRPTPAVSRQARVPGSRPRAESRRSPLVSSGGIAARHVNSLSDQFVSPNGTEKCGEHVAASAVSCVARNLSDWRIVSMGVVDYFATPGHYPHSGRRTLSSCSGVVAERRIRRQSHHGACADDLPSRCDEDTSRLRCRRGQLGRDDRHADERTGDGRQLDDPNRARGADLEVAWRCPNDRAARGRVSRGTSIRFCTRCVTASPWSGSPRWRLRRVARRERRGGS